MGKQKVNIYNLSQLHSQSQRIEYGLSTLGLNGMLAFYNKIAKRAISDRYTPHDFLEDLLEKEFVLKEENRLQRRIMLARFPWIKILKEFDFSFQKDLDEKLIYELASCRFIEEAHNIVFFGPAGVGKTHLSISLGMEAISKGYEVRFFTLSQLIDQVEKAEERTRTNILLGSLLRQKLLILDEMDLYDVSQSVSNFLFKLLYQRHLKGSVIFTSNRSFDEWEKIFGSRVRASAIIDRINENCTRIIINGDSYRVKDRIRKV